MKPTTTFLALLLTLVGIFSEAQDRPTVQTGPKAAVTTLPSFRLYRMTKEEGVFSVVVPPNTTDEQLKRLIWYFREKVGTGQFKAIGIAKPTNLNSSGNLAYGAGIIAVYRGEKCANELFLDRVGPCGYGDHDSASYEWGVDGHPGKDSGLIRANNGDLQKVF